MQKIESLKNLKKDDKERPAQIKNVLPDKKVLPPTPPIQNNSAVNQKKRE